MSHKLLSSDGTVCQIDANWLSAATTVSVEHVDAVERILTQHQCNKQRLLIEFASDSDGRGFSLAGELREAEDFDMPLFATGNLLPDQLALVFQCGFDGAIVDRQRWLQYSETAWLQALEPIVDNGYQLSKWQAINSIWERRAACG